MKTRDRRFRWVIQIIGVLLVIFGFPATFWLFVKSLKFGMLATGITALVTVITYLVGMLLITMSISFNKKPEKLFRRACYAALFKGVPIASVCLVILDGPWTAHLLSASIFPMGFFFVSLMLNCQDYIGDWLEQKFIARFGPSS